MQKSFKYIFLFIFSTMVLGTVAQTQRDTLRREVEVTKAYTPTVSDANKLNSMPQIDETEHQQPTFNYSINSKPVFSNFSLTPLKAATIENVQHNQEGYGLVRAGLGNYNKPYAEVYFNNLNSKNSVFGIHAKHLSSFGNIKLKGGDEVDAPFMNNELELFVKNSFRNSILSVNGDLKHDGFKYYGYPISAVPSYLLDDDQQVNYFGTKQSFVKGGIQISLDNPSAEMDEQNFGFDFDYHYFGTKTEQREHDANFNIDYRQPLTAGMGLLKAGVEYISEQQIYLEGDSALGNKSATILFAKPAWYLGNETANVKLGIGMWFIMESDEDTQAKIAPDIRANWAPVKEIINLYAGIDGDFINNHYSKIAYENPFVNPTHNVRNSMQHIRFFGGFDGKFSEKTAFKISGEYALITDQPLYYLKESYYWPGYSSSLEGILTIDNTFAVLYDDMNRMKLNAEIYHASSDKLDLLFSVNYYSYKLDNQEEAWNLPQWDATFSAGYKITEQFSVKADVFLVGERKALILQEPSIYSNTVQPIANSYSLDPIIDINLKGNYKLTSKFDLFAQLNNLGFQGYERWFGYPVQNFNFLAGISYAF